MVSSKDWEALLPKPWDLAADQQWHVFISYSSDSVPVIDLYDALTARGYKVQHEKHKAWSSNAEKQCAAAVLVKPSATVDPNWYEARRDGFEQRAKENPGFRFACWDTALLPLGSSLLKLLC